MTKPIHAHVIDRVRVTDGASFRLADHATREDFGLALDKAAAKQSIADRMGRLSELQDVLYADNRRSLLLIFQAMDAAGKDGAIKHVASGINPQGCQVFSFKAPSPEELDHDFLWRTTVRLPERGRIGIFNRSYYEEVLVVRVHPDLLAKQHLPTDVSDPDAIWRQRFKSIRAFEKHMARNGTRVLKFYLHLSRSEQKKRLLERIDDPSKNWKFETGDLAERARWTDYMHAYEDAIRHTASEKAPWYCIPADDKWTARVLIQEAVISELESLNLAYPVLDETARAALQESRRQLVSEP